MKGKNTLPPLQKGDKIALVATARKVSPEEMAPAITQLKSWGFDVIEPQGLYAAENQMAGSDDHRATVFQWALDSDDIKAILCVRGGYGTVRMIDKIDFSHFEKHPKWIIGYSDVTVLHSHINRQVGLPTLHATMPINFDGTQSPATDTLRAALMGEALEYAFDPHPFNRTGTATATAVGGNLSILYSLLGSPSDVDTSGKILMIEDLDEYLYHIDRMMMALKRAGKLSHLRALVVGAMSDMHDNTIPFGRTAEEIVRDAVRDYDYPVIFGAKFGHIGHQNHAIPLGVEWRLEVRNDGASSMVYDPKKNAF